MKIILFLLLFWVQASRAQILKKTTECIQIMRRKIQANQKDVEDIKKQNELLEAQSKLCTIMRNILIMSNIFKL